MKMLIEEGEKKPNKLCFDDLELSTLGLKNIEKPETIFEKIYKTAWRYEIKVFVCGLKGGCF